MIQLRVDSVVRGTLVESSFSLSSIRLRNWLELLCSNGSRLELPVDPAVSPANLSQSNSSRCAIRSIIETWSIESELSSVGPSLLLQAAVFHHSFHGGVDQSCIPLPNPRNGNSHSCLVLDRPGWRSHPCAKMGPRPRLQPASRRMARREGDL
jgi:hypothetical protein